MFEAYKIGVAIHLTNHVSGGLSSLMRDFAKTDAEAAKLQKRIDGIKMGLTGGLIAMGAGVALAAMFKPAIDDAMKFERAMLRLKDIGGINASVVTQVRSDALSGKYQGIGATESVDLVRDLHAAFGDAKEALEFMPLFAGMARVTQGKYGKSAVAGEEDVRALAKVAERRGGTKSPAAMEGAMDLAIKIQNASGGAVTPKDLLAFMNRMGAMGNSMSNTGIMKMWALMQEQGGSKAGTAMNSALQNMVNGKGTEGAGFEMRKFGLVDEGKQAAYLRSRWGAKWAVHINKLSPDVLVDAELARTDMVGWVQKNLIPRFDKKLDAMGITDGSKRDMQKSSWISTMFSNRMGADSAALMATQMVRIMKDFHIAGGSAGLRDSIKSFDESPMAKFQQLHANWDTALTNLGEAALPIAIPLVNRLSAAIKTFSEYAEKNPGVVSGVVKGILGVAGALIVLGGATVIVNGLRAVGLAFTVLNAFSFTGLAAGIRAFAVGPSSFGVLGAVIGAIASPIGIAVLAIGTIVAALYAFSPLSEREINAAKFEGGATLSPSAKARLDAMSPVQRKAFDVLGASSFARRSSAQNAQPSLAVGPPPRMPSTFKVENKFDALGISTKITEIQSKALTRQPTGPRNFDPMQSLFPVTAALGAY